MSTSFNYPLHTATRRQLDRIAAQPGHAYLFYGPNYTYKQRSAEQLALALTGAKSLDHPNIIQLSSGDGNSIKIAAIKNLLEQLSLTAFDISAHRVVIVRDAHSMTSDASNALLKALEEPGEGIVFVLITNRLQNILTTIRSRAQLVSFLAVTQDGLPALPRLAEALEEDNELRSRYEQTTALVDRFIHGGLTDRFAVAQQVADKKIEATFVEILEQQLAASSKQSATSFELIDRLMQAEDAIEHNVSSRLCFENLALEIAA